jgi:hypothetical protein
MHFALPDDSPDRSADPAEPRAARQQVSTTATLIVAALCAILAKAHLLEARSHGAAAAALNDVAAPTKVVAPEFCKDQTWPYIDSRCLRRVDTPPPANEPKVVAPPTTAAAVTPAPASDSPAATTVAATPAPATAPMASVPASAPSAPDSQAQVIQSVFPPTPPSAAPDGDAANGAADAPTYQPTSDSTQHRRSRHWNNHYGFFGFRF